jgi:hypothetical protein
MEYDEHPWATQITAAPSEAVGEDGEAFGIARLTQPSVKHDEAISRG